MFDKETVREVPVDVKVLHTKIGQLTLEALYKRSNISKKHPGHKICPYLLRDLSLEEAIQVWALDTTYILITKGGPLSEQIDSVAERMNNDIYG